METITSLSLVLVGLVTPLYVFTGSNIAPKAKRDYVLVFRVGRKDFLRRLYSIAQPGLVGVRAEELQGRTFMTILLF